MALDGALRDLADTDTDPRASFTIRFGTVATVTAGGATDGNAQVTVTVNSSTFPAPYLAAYTPNVGDVVAVALIDGSPLILGKRIGTPTF